MAGECMGGGGADAMLPEGFCMSNQWLLRDSDELEPMQASFAKYMHRMLHFVSAARDNKAYCCRGQLHVHTSFCPDIGRCSNIENTTGVEAVCMSLNSIA